MGGDYSIDILASFGSGNRRAQGNVAAVAPEAVSKWLVKSGQGELLLALESF
jgi:hypothetical protein